MNPIKSLDTFVGRLLYPLLVRTDAKGFLGMGYTEPKALAKIIYNRRSKDWKRYKVKLSDIEKITNKVCEVKPLKGLGLWIGLIKARKTIRRAINQKRLIFVGENKVEYTDKGFCKYKTNFEELARIFIEKTQQGFEPCHIVGILEKEYKRRKS